MTQGLPPSRLPSQGTGVEVAAGAEGDGGRWCRALAPFPSQRATPQVPPHSARPAQGCEGGQEMAAALFPPLSSLTSPRSLRRPKAGLAVLNPL